MRSNLFSYVSHAKSPSKLRQYYATMWLIYNLQQVNLKKCEYSSEVLT